MVSILGYHVNKAVLVSIPPLFGNGEPRRCYLIGTEPGGLWLRCSDLSLTARFNEKPEAVTVFVPFTQIAYLLEASAEASRDAVMTNTSGPRRKGSGVEPKRRRG
jgi:hypothetical protein